MGESGELECEPDRLWQHDSCHLPYALTLHGFDLLSVAPISNV
jgi:hypothetical protein